jgi:pyridoxal phosphate enzyme (YggS family)
MSTAVALSTGIAGRLAAVQEQIDAAAQRAGRRPEDVTLVAVSKTFGVDLVEAAIAAGVTDLGENRVQEAEEKIPAVTGKAHWHLIGHLQKNKVNKALELFDLIHGVDSLALAEAIGRRAERLGVLMRVLLQVNVTGAGTQFGLDALALTGEAERCAAVPGLTLDGLMCIAPHVDDPEAARPAFRQLAGLHARLAPAMHAAGHPWRHLSMGMSNDYPVAVEEGATLVRVGRAIFGERG